MSQLLVDVIAKTWHIETIKYGWYQYEPVGYSINSKQTHKLLKLTETLKSTFSFNRNRRCVGRAQLRRVEHARVLAALPHPAQHEGPRELGNLGAEDVPFGRRHFGLEVDAASAVRRSRSAPLRPGYWSDNSRKIVNRLECLIVVGVCCSFWLSQFWK